MDTHTLVNSNHRKPIIVSNGNISNNSNRATQEHDIVQMQLETQTTTPSTGAVNTSIHSTHKGKAMRQVVAAFIANLGTINTGLAFGFSAVVIPQLQRPDSIIKIDENQMSWIGKTHKLIILLSSWSNQLRMELIGRGRGGGLVGVVLVKN